MTVESMLVRGTYPGAKAAVDLDIRKGRVHAVLPVGRRAADVGDANAVLAPGLCDIQVNGAGGYDIQSSELSVDTLYGLNQYLNARGVFRWTATLVTDDAAAMEHKCRVLARALEDKSLARHIAGIHLEGPHISPEDGPRGAHPAEHVRPPDLKLFQRLQRAAEGHIRYVTLAPELPGAVLFIRALVQSGVLVALGHHAAGAKDIRAAAGAGARLCTHLANGMAPNMHRHHNPLWPQLADDRLFASVIADLQHVPADLLQVILRAKSPRRMVLVSDSVLLAGMKPGRYHIFGADVEKKRSGRVCLAGTELLAGSSLLLPDAVMNMARATDMTLAQAFNAASRVPARLVGARMPAWPPRAGSPAAFVLYPGPDGKGRGRTKPLLVCTG